jgi:hypothetical protein
VAVLRTVCGLARAPSRCIEARHRRRAPSALLGVIFVIVIAAALLSGPAE